MFGPFPYFFAGPHSAPNPEFPSRGETPEEPLAPLSGPEAFTSPNPSRLKAVSLTGTRIDTGQRLFGVFAIKPSDVAVRRSVFPAIPAVDGVILLESAHVNSGSEIMEALTHCASDSETGSGRFEDQPQVTGFTHEEPVGAVGRAAEQLRAAH